MPILRSENRAARAAHSNSLVTKKSHPEFWVALFVFTHISGVVIIFGSTGVQDQPNRLEPS